MPSFGSTPIEGMKRSGWRLKGPLRHLVVAPIMPMATPCLSIASMVEEWR